MLQEAVKVPCECLLGNDTLIGINISCPQGTHTNKQAHTHTPYRLCMVITYHNNIVYNISCTLSSTFKLQYRSEQAMSQSNNTTQVNVLIWAL